MEYFRFWSEKILSWQDKSWLKLDDVTPYNIRHSNQRGMLPCIGHYHFLRYYGKHTNNTWENYKDSKKRKLFWRLHPEQRARHDAV